MADAGAEITIASPNGGQPSVDPKSELGNTQTPSTERFYKDTGLIDKVAYSLKLNDIKQQDMMLFFIPEETGHYGI